jgi:signal transduction histidine kinase/CheY-like chemotaxis protein
MKDIILKRNNLFLSYLRLRSNSMKDKVMASKFDTLTEILTKEHITADTSVRTSQKKSTTITYLTDTTRTEGQKRSFLSKLFRKKTAPEPAPLPDRTVTEEVQITVDTIAIAKNNRKIAEAARLIDELGMNQLNIRKKLANRELELLATSRDLFRELVDIVHAVESEEMAQVRKNNEAALNVVDDSSEVIVAILLAFSLMAAVLVYLIMIDVTRSNFFKTGLIKEKERAEELSHVKERFLSNMSHEIRTPLQSIIGYSEQLRSNPLADTDVAIKAISDSSVHLLHIINEVLDYSRLESGKIEFEKGNFYPLEIAEEVALTLRLQAEKKGLELLFETTMASNELVEGDEFRLRQVLYNLLGNAIKFTSKGSVKLIVSGVVENQELKARFEVLDTGIGIRHDDIDKIFHRFEQANASVENKYGGTGLGLTIVKMIAEGQGGHIKVNSKEGEGSSFAVEITYNCKQPEPRSIASKRLKAPSGIHVLVLDDDPLIVELCGLMLSNAKIPFEVCERPEELLRSNINPKITHILMDVRLGTVNGVELCRSLKKRIDKNVKIFAMTAMAGSNTSQGSLDVFEKVLRKPFRAQELYSLFEVDMHTENISVGNEPFSNVRKMINNDEVLFQSVLADFVEETNRDIVMVERAIDDKKDTDMLVLVHRLAGRVNQFGFGDLSSSLRQIEMELEMGSDTMNVRNQWDQQKASILSILTRL